MRGFVRATAIAGALGTAALLAVPTASAASGPAVAAPECVTDSQTHKHGRGEIEVCVENGQARVTGWVEDLLPGGGWVTPDGGCAIWWITFRTTSGTQLHGSHMACPHFGQPAYREFTYDANVQNVTGVEELYLGTAWL